MVGTKTLLTRVTYSCGCLSLQAPTNIAHGVFNFFKLIFYRDSLFHPTMFDRTILCTVIWNTWCHFDVYCSLPCIVTCFGSPLHSHSAVV